MKTKKFIKSLCKLYNDPLEDSMHPTCPECGAIMDFHGHDDDGDFEIGYGFWKCSECGFTVFEHELK